MTIKDQELLAEAYLTEVFGFGSKPQMIDIKKELDPESYNIVTSVFQSNPSLQAFVQSCNKISCLIDKNKIPKICNILKKEYDASTESDERSDSIIDAHDVLAQLYSPASNYHSTAPSQPWGYEPPNG